MSARLFARSVYTEDAVRAAGEAYAAVAQATIETRPEGFLVTLQPIEEIADLEDEFANHVLHETITLRNR